MTVAFDAGELEVHAVAPIPGGGLYAATSPDGRIYHVAADGTSRSFFDPDDKYIWALALDRSGTLFAATGDKGVIYRITPDGTGTPFYRTNTTNVVSLAFTPDGQLLAGTESPGRVYRIDSAGKGFVLLDSPYREIHAIRVAPDGTMYAAAVNGAGSASAPASEPVASEPPRPPVPTVSAEITSVAPVEGPMTGAPATSAPARARRVGRGAIYRIRPDGLWDLLWDAGDDAPFDLVIEPDGALLVGTGTEGKIFRLAGDPARATLVARAGARQVTALVREALGPHPRRDEQPRQGLRAVARAGRARHLRVGHPRCRHRRELGRDPLARRAPRRPHRGPDPLGQHVDARRHLERLVEAVHERRRRADRQPERPLPAVAARDERQQRAGPGADVGHRGLPAAQPASGGERHHGASARHRVPAAVLDR